MAGDDLHRPLGLKGKSRARRPQAGLIASVGAGFVILAGLGAVLISGDPMGGEPFAVATLPPPLASVPGDDRTPTGSVRPSTPALAASPAPTAQLENGVSVFRGKPAHETAPLVIKVQQALGLSDVAPVDKHLVEMTRYGPLPRIGDDGTRPSEVYARPPVFSRAIAPATPRIAICLGGLGLRPAETAEAIAAMPAAVSLAFSPYGDTLDSDVARAKASGHEVILQLPAQSDGDGQGNTRPHALRGDAAPAVSIDDLHWLMSRMSGYVGVSDFPGGALTADHGAMTTMLKDIDQRGLLYVEDMPRGQSAAAFAPPGLARAHTDVVLDPGAGADGWRAALLKLEAIARTKGSAIVEASVSPATLAALAAFAQTLDAKGLSLVPVSALAIAGGAPSVAATP